MILYHGSNEEVKEPRLLKIQREMDFGKGFYATSDLEQATRQAPVINMQHGRHRSLTCSLMRCKKKQSGAPCHKKLKDQFTFKTERSISSLRYQAAEHI